MENASISDIMWNLKSAFQEVTFRGAEDELVKREQQLKSENAATKAKYDAVLLENDTLKRQLSELRRQRGGFKENYSFKDSDKIRRLEADNEAARRRAREAKDEADRVLRKARVLEEELEGNRKKVGVLEAEKAEAMEKVAVLEKEKAETMEKVGVLEKEKAKAMEKVGVLEREKEEARVDMEEVLEKIRVLEKEKEEKEERIVWLEREKEKVAAEAEREKKSVALCKERIDILMKVPGPNLSYSNGVFDGAHTDVEDNLDTDIKEEYNSQDPVYTPKLSGQNACKPATAPIIYISDSESDDEGVHSPNGLKRKRDSSGSSNTRLVDKANKRVTKERESETPREMTSGSANHSPPPVGSAYDQSPSRSIEAGKCSDDEELTSDAQWQFEADMLNAFEEHPILTMEAVCALYRHQKYCGLGYGLGLSRNRGFDAVHAFRGMALAEFLLDGNPLSRMKKTLEELQLHDPKGLDDCKSIASVHSGKLFAIYQMQEDPYFGPE